MNRMTLIITLGVIISVMALVSIVWMSGRSDVSGISMDKSLVIENICSTLPRQNGQEPHSFFEVQVYLNKSGDIGGYRAYKPDMDGGISYYYSSEGTLIGEWVIVDSSELSKDVSIMMKKFPIHEKIHCKQMLRT